MIKKHIRKIALGLSTIFCLSTPLTALATGKGEYPSGEILSFGSTLSKAQENGLRAYFGAPNDIEAIYVTSEVAIKQLGLEGTAYDNFTGGWYSSAYVKLNAGETGVNVTSNNLTLVTDDMLANALITSGILNADIIASAPFAVTGESALAGILAGAEEIMGGDLNIEGKQAAQKEIEVSLDLAEEIGATEATALINEIKTTVIKDNPSTERKIEKIVTSAVKNYDIKLTEEMKGEVVSLMSDINDLNIDYSAVKDTLNKASSKFKEDMKALGKELKDSGFFDRIINWIKNLWNSIFGSSTEDTTDKDVMPSVDETTNSNLESNVDESAEIYEPSADETTESEPSVDDGEATETDTSTVIVGNENNN